MLANIVTITALLFGICYPVFLLGNYAETAKSGFYRFNLGLASVIAGLVVVSLVLTEIELSMKVVAMAWLFSLLVVTAYLWRRDVRQRWFLIVPTLLGAAVLFHYHKFHLSGDLSVYLMSALGGFILCASIFAMNLGHWYLNVKNLPIGHLKRATYVFAALLALRLLLDGYFLATQSVEHSGNMVVLSVFMQGIDGFLLSIALLFGTILPIILIFLVIETLKLKSTQSATGLLYVIVISVLIGDLTYRYYLIRYGIVL